MSAFSTEDLTVNYDHTPVLWQLNLEIPQGVLACILGPNGAGKSTLLKTALNLHKPIGGSCSLLGGKYKENRHRIAYVPQRTSVDWTFPVSVIDVVLMGRYGKLGWLKWANKKDRIAAKEALERVDMLPFASRQISELSGGQQQRVFLARALLQGADLYFMDEPFSGVDMATEKALIALMRDLKEEGKTLIIVHHDLTTVLEYFDWTVLLNSCLIGCGPTDEVFCEEMLTRAYGNASYLLGEAKKLAKLKTTGG